MTSRYKSSPPNRSFKGRRGFDVRGEYDEDQVLVSFDEDQEQASYSHSYPESDESDTSILSLSSVANDSPRSRRRSSSSGKSGQSTWENHIKTAIDNQWQNWNKLIQPPSWFCGDHQTDDLSAMPCPSSPRDSNEDDKTAEKQERGKLQSASFDRDISLLTFSSEDNYADEEVVNASSPRAKARLRGTNSKTHPQNMFSSNESSCINDNNPKDEVSSQSKFSEDTYIASNANFQNRDLDSRLGQNYKAGSLKSSHGEDYSPRRFAEQSTFSSFNPYDTDGSLSIGSSAISHLPDKNHPAQGTESITNKSPSNHQSEPTLVESGGNSEIEDSDDDITEVYCSPLPSPTKTTRTVSFAENTVSTGFETLYTRQNSYSKNAPPPSPSILKRISSHKKSLSALQRVESSDSKRLDTEVVPLSTIEVSEDSKETPERFKDEEGLEDEHGDFSEMRTPKASGSYSNSGSFDNEAQANEKSSKSPKVEVESTKETTSEPNVSMLAKTLSALKTSLSLSGSPTQEANMNNSSDAERSIPESNPNDKSVPDKM